MYRSIYISVHTLRNTSKGGGGSKCDSPILIVL